MRWTLYGPRFLPVRGDVSHPNQGGFDVVIGNPPYVNRRELSYRITGFETDNVDDIYASCCERSAQITRPDGRLSLIVPIRSQFADRDESLRKFYERRRRESRPERPQTPVSVSEVSTERIKSLL